MIEIGSNPTPVTAAGGTREEERHKRIVQLRGANRRPKDGGGREAQKKKGRTVSTGDGVTDGAERGDNPAEVEAHRPTNPSHRDSTLSGSGRKIVKAGSV